jgi:flavin reductase
MADRFIAAEWSTAVTGSPVLSGAVASFDCRITQIVSVGTHDTLFCEVVGLVRNDDTHGLAWFDRGYHPLLRQDAC